MQKRTVYETGWVSETLPPSSSTSTGCLSRLSYHWMTLPIRKHHEPQKVANEPWYTQPLFFAAKPRAPQSVNPIPLASSQPCPGSDKCSLKQGRGAVAYPYKIPYSDMPSQHFGSREIPFLLSFNHEEKSGDYEAAATNHLWQPICTILGSSWGQARVNRWKSCEARDPLWELAIFWIVCFSSK